VDSVGNIQRYTQTGDHFQWWSPRLDVSVGSVGGGDINYIVSTPLGMQLIGQFRLNDVSSINGFTGMAGADPASQSVSTNTSNADVVVDGARTNFAGNAGLLLRTDTSSRIRLTQLSPGGGTSHQLRTLGWFDRRVD
jgi:hypothetical protein